MAFDCSPKGKFLGLDVNGKRVRFAENVFYEFRAEKIVQVWSVIDKALSKLSFEGSSMIEASYGDAVRGGIPTSPLSLLPADEKGPVAKDRPVMTIQERVSAPPAKSPLCCAPSCFLCALDRPPAFDGR